MKQLYQLGGLDGVKGGRLKAAYGRTPTGFINALRMHRACTSAGDHGAVTVWRDDEGAFRCHFTVKHSDVNAQVFRTKAAVRGWLTEWLPQMRVAP